MARLFRLRTLAAAGALLLVAVLLPPLIIINRFQPRVEGAISRALGRSATTGKIRLRLFPTPGLTLEHLVVHDDPGFSAEPLLRADNAELSFRLASLWRGRFEIARLSLPYASLNLVRASSGHWNLESLLERARQVPTAPTAKRRAETRPRFPYIEATGGRINLKLGQEKTVYALSDADFALWLASENEWRLRLRARPVRTDANLGDTGEVRITGQVKRASSLSEMPVDLQVGWERAQLGQLTTLIYGRDRGWRGTVTVSVGVQGEPADLRIAGDASVDDFRRYDIASSGALRLAAHCSGAFSTLTQQLSQVVCQAPVGAGAVEIRGRMRGIIQPEEYGFSVLAQNVPANALVALVRRMKKDLPEDLEARGAVGAAFDIRKQAGEPAAWAGSGGTTALQLRSGLMTTPLQLGQLRFVFGSTEPAAVWSKTMAAGSPASAVEASLHIEAFPLPLGGTQPARTEAWFSRSAYNVAVQGDSELERLLQIAHVLGVHAPAVRAQGNVKVNLHLAGNWTGFALPVVLGNAQLHQVYAHIPGVATPLQIEAASVILAPDQVDISNITAAFPTTQLALSGWVRLPRGCASVEACPARFQLRAEQVSTGDLNALLNPRLRSRPWYDLIGGSRSQGGWLGRVTARGQITATRVSVDSLVASHVTGDAQLTAGVLTIGNLRGEVFGGKHIGELRADFTGSEPTYAARGSLQQFSVGAVLAATHEGWATGRATGTYTASAKGFNAEQLCASASGSLGFDWRDGTVAHLALEGGADSLRIRQFQGTVALNAGKLTFAPSKMETAGSIYVVSGTASLNRELGLKLVRDKGLAYEITGTIEKPLVKALSAQPPDTQTALAR